MPRLALNKTSLTRESRQLDTYERFLPSLDLKRRQLMAERNRARRQLAALESEVRDIVSTIGSTIPMAADKRLNLDGLVVVKRVDIGEENLVGLRIPVLREVSTERAAYSFLARPHWVDVLAEIMKSLMEYRIRIQVQTRRLDLLEEAVRKTTQRVNLFDKVLIPRTRNNIRRIQIVLSDAEKAAVVNAKIAKRQRQQKQ